MISRRRLMGGDKKLRYIESTGTQYIVEHLYPQGYTYHMRVAFLSGKEQYMLGAEQSSNRTGTFKVYNSNFGWAFLKSYGNTGLGAVILNQIYDINVKSLSGDFEIKIDGVIKKTSTATGSFPQKNCSLFACNLYGAGTYPAIARLYDFSITDASTDLTRHYVPCELDRNLSDDECANPSLSHQIGDIGLWELTENKFYANAGTGVFMAGY